MTAPTDPPIEDRLRAHFADRARTMAIPGPESDEALARARDGLPLRVEQTDELAVRRTRWTRPRLVAAAVLAVVALVAGVAIARRDDDGDVSTDPTPPPTTEPDVPATTETTPDTTTSTSQPAAPPGAAPTGPIVGPYGVLGSWDGTAWLQWDVDAPAPSTREYQVVALDAPIRTATGSPAPGCVVAPSEVVDVGLERGGSGRWLGVGIVAAPVELQPRPVEVLEPAAEVYLAAAAEVGASLGVAAPQPRVTQVVRADLDGDGTAEVVVAAEQLADPESPLATPGEWAALFVRRVVGGEVRTTVVASSVTTEETAPFIELFWTAAVADLNGDGDMELVVNGRYYEGTGTTVFDDAIGTPTEVLTAGCGA